MLVFTHMSEKSPYSLFNQPGLASYESHQSTPLAGSRGATRRTETSAPQPESTPTSRRNRAETRKTSAEAKKASLENEIEVIPGLTIAELTELREDLDFETAQKYNSLKTSAGELEQEALDDAFVLSVKEMVNEQVPLPDDGEPDEEAKTNRNLLSHALRADKKSYNRFTDGLVNQHKRSTRKTRVAKDKIAATASKAKIALSDRAARTKTAREANVAVAQERANRRELRDSHDGLVGRLSDAEWTITELNEIQSKYNRLADLDYITTNGGVTPNAFKDAARIAAIDLIDKKVAEASVETKEDERKLRDQLNADIYDYASADDEDRVAVQESMVSYAELKAASPEITDEPESKERFGARAKKRARLIGAGALAFAGAAGTKISNGASRLRARWGSIGTSEQPVAATADETEVDGQLPLSDEEEAADESTPTRKRKSLNDRLLQMQVNHQANRLAKQHAEEERLAAMTEEERTEELTRQAQERKENRRKYRNLAIGAGVLIAATTAAYLATRHGHHAADLIPGKGGHGGGHPTPEVPVPTPNKPVEPTHITTINDFITGHEGTTHFNEKGVDNALDWLQGHKVKPGETIWGLSKAYQQHLGHKPDLFTTDAIKDQLVPALQRSGNVGANGKLQAGVILNFK